MLRVTRYINIYLGPFYISTKEIFLILTAILLGVAMYLNWDTVFFDKKILFTLAIIILFVKGLLPGIHNEAFFLNTLVTVFLSLYLPAFQVILFFFISFAFFRILKII